MGERSIQAVPACTVLVVMGVSGSGKTTVARALADRLGLPFQEGDALHPAANVAKMTAGTPLTDEDRGPWLAAIAAWIDRQRAARQSGVVTCSALKRAYRRVIVGERPDVRLVHLKGDREAIAARLATRTGHFMPPSLLDSQFDALEEPDETERPITVDVAWPIERIVDRIVQMLMPQPAQTAGIPDPFREVRRTAGVLGLPTDREVIPMILRHDDVRKAAKDWKTYSSDTPFRVPIPSEEHLRSVRQLPIEVDPPEQTDYRELVEPFFLRAKQPAFVARVEELTERLVADSVARAEVEAVGEFALPLQSRALTVLLGAPEAEAERFIAWGVHIFHGETGVEQGAALERYLNEQFDRAAAAPGDDFYGVLTKATFRGRSLTREEMLGFANLMFAGGRDTIIHTVSSIIGYFAGRPEALDALRADPDRIVHASEEFFRVFMPLTHIGRTCPVDTDVHGIPVKAGDRASLCWASANLDEEVFENADEIQLDRRPNPHVSFGFGVHLCLGAAHARTVVRTLLAVLCRRVARIELVSQRDRVEHTAAYDRQLGYDSLVVTFHRA